MVGQLGMHVFDPQTDTGLYHPAAPGEIQPTYLGIHVGDDPESFIPRLTALAREVDPTVVIARPRPLDEVFEIDWYLTVVMSVGGAILIGILLTLAASGIYALLSFAVSARTREIGIRSALGAGPLSIVATIVKRSLTQLGAGVLLGSPVAAWLSLSILDSESALSTLARAIGPIVIVMFLIGLLACTAPTLRALRIRPLDALRTDA